MKSRVHSLIFFVITILFFSACGNDTTTKTPEKESTKTLTLEEASKKVYVEKGKAIAQETFATLAGQLKNAIKGGGVPEAIKYCNLAAFPLVDNLSKKHNVTIRRTTLKARNSKNAPTVLEKEILEQYTVKANKGEKLAPIAKENNNITTFYAPIKINDFCLQCHGKIGETLTEEDFKIIQKYYPDDKATDYLVGDLRGMWSIQFNQ